MLKRTKMKTGNFQKSFKLPKTMLVWAGIGIFSKNDNRSVAYLIKSCKFYFNLFWLGSAILGELCWLIDGIYTGQNLDELYMTAPCCTVCVLAMVKFNCVYFNRDVVEKVVDKLRNIHADVDEEFKKLNKVNKERRIVKNAMQLLNIVVTILLVASVSCVTVFIMATILSMAYDYINTGSMDFKLPFRMKYFFEMNGLITWVLMYVHQVGAMFIATIDLLSADILFYTFCTYIQMHFQLLCIQFENVVSYGKNSKIETRKNCRRALRRHQELIELVEQIELLYSKSSLCNIILSSMLICLSGFIVTFFRSDLGAMSSFLAFLIMNLSQISLFCYFGELLNSTSTRVSNAVYNSLWYDAEMDFKKNVLTVIIRANKPCKLTAMKFADLNLNALSAILRTSWSYFALLKTIYD